MAKSTVSPTFLSDQTNPLPQGTLWQTPAKAYLCWSKFVAQLAKEGYTVFRQMRLGNTYTTPVYVSDQFSLFWPTQVTPTNCTHSYRNVWFSVSNKCVPRTPKCEWVTFHSRHVFFPNFAIHLYKHYLCNILYIYRDYSQSKLYTWPIQSTYFIKKQIEYIYDP